MNERLDLMVDIETLGNEMNSTIIQLACVPFDIETGAIYEDETFNEIADIEKNETALEVSASTLKWWLETDKELFTRLLNSGSLSTEGIIRLFHRQVKEWQSRVGIKNVYLWGNGILFDNQMIKCQMEAIGLYYPIPYKNDRDVRTILELASAKSGVSEREIKDKLGNGVNDHNAINDVLYQINYVSECYRYLTSNTEELGE